MTASGCCLFVDEPVKNIVCRACKTVHHAQTEKNLTSTVVCLECPRDFDNGSRFPLNARRHVRQLRSKVSDFGVGGVDVRRPETSIPLPRKPTARSSARVNHLKREHAQLSASVPQSKEKCQGEVPSHRGRPGASPRRVEEEIISGTALRASVHGALLRVAHSCVQLLGPTDICLP